MIGDCKLCLQPRELQDSHFIPAAMYKYLRDPDETKKNRNPTVVAAKVTATTSRQVSDYVLCADCEELFNKNGESWVLQQVWNGERFALGERLNLALQHYTFQNFLAFSGTAMGINTEALGYFALSVIWRGAVHQWNTPFGGKTRVLKLGAHEESIRFLFGVAPFPTDVVILATVCTDPFSRGVFYMPSQTSGIPRTSFAMLTLGVHFMVFVGTPLPPVLYEMCCVKSAHKLIFQRDCSEKTLEAFAQLLNQRPVPIIGT